VFAIDVLLVAVGIVVVVKLIHVVVSSSGWGQSTKPATEPFIAAIQQTEMIVNIAIF
jgi:hypothetical protein